MCVALPWYCLYVYQCYAPFIVEFDGIVTFNGTGLNAKSQV